MVVKNYLTFFKKSNLERKRNLQPPDTLKTYGPGRKQKNKKEN